MTINNIYAEMFAKVTESAAISASKFRGKNDKILVDDFYKTEIQNNYNVYCVYPSLIKQRKSMSNIFNSVMSYNFD